MALVCYSCVSVNLNQNLQANCFPQSLEVQQYIVLIEWASSVQLH